MRTRRMRIASVGLAVASTRVPLAAEAVGSTVSFTLPVETTTLFTRGLRTPWR